MFTQKLRTQTRLSKPFSGVNGSEAENTSTNDCLFVFMLLIADLYEKGSGLKEASCGNTTPKCLFAVDHYKLQTGNNVTICRDSFFN